MATLGTFTAGQVLTAIELNAIGTWQTFTPNWRPQTGAWISGTLVSARYTKINETVIGFTQYNITNAGTGSADVYFNLPVTAAEGANASIGGGRESNLTGDAITARLVTTGTAGVRTYDNNELSGNLFHMPVFFMYESA